MGQDRFACPTSTVQMTISFQPKPFSLWKWARLCKPNPFELWKWTKLCKNSHFHNRAVKGAAGVAEARRMGRVSAVFSPICCCELAEDARWCDPILHGPEVRLLCIDYTGTQLFIPDLEPKES